MAAHIFVHGAAAGLLASGLIPLPFVVLSLSRLIGLRLRDWVSLAWRPLLSTAIMMSVIVLWQSTASPVLGDADFLLLVRLTTVVFGAVIYAVSIL
jgi:hypothetical protein